MKRKIVSKLIALSALLFLLGVLLLLKTNQAVCEFFATTFSRAWIFLFGNLFGWLPFSVYELFLVAVIVGAVVCLVLIIKQLCARQWKRALSAVISVALAVVVFANVYTATASFSYNREPLPDEVYTEYTAEDFSFDDAVSLATALVQEANDAYRNTRHDENGNIVYPYTFSEMSDKIAEEYAKLQSDYFSPYTPKAKKIINKWIMSQMHIVGVFFAPTGEANINGNETNMYLPCTMAHEMAHGKGVMREYEANIVSTYVLLNSDDVYLRYGVLTKMMFSALSLLAKYPNYSDTLQSLLDTVDTGIFRERDNYSKFYGQFTLFDDIGEFFNDLYLKLQNQHEGTGSYEKPGETEGTGEVDGDGNEIVVIVRFSDMENLLIKLYKQNLFTTKAS